MKGPKKKYPKHIYNKETMRLPKTRSTTKEITDKIKPLIGQEVVDKEGLMIRIQDEIEKYVNQTQKDARFKVSIGKTYYDIPLSDLVDGDYYVNSAECKSPDVSFSCQRVFITKSAPYCFFIGSDSPELCENVIGTFTKLESKI